MLDKLYRTMLSFLLVVKPSPCPLGENSSMLFFFFLQKCFAGYKTLHRFSDSTRESR